ncbi:MAG: hypothetical protein V4591_12270, partial [Bdellovibrionota bacterium]
MTMIESKQDLNFNPQALPKIPLPTKVLMVSPTFFNVDTPINAHMLNAQGQPHVLDKNKALKQWNELKSVYKKLNLEVSVLNGVEDLPDMVFCANQSFPFLDATNERHAI